MFQQPAHDRILTVIRVVLLKIGVGITAEDGTVRSEVQEGVEEMSDLASRDIGGLVVTGIDTPSRILLVLIGEAFDFVESSHQLTK